MARFGILFIDATGLLRHIGDPRQRDVYRVAIVADPQLTDWYSYKQAGYALYLTELYTDLFMRRSFRQLRQQLRPDLVLFLGDLLDGGRETLDDERFDRNVERFHAVFATEETDWNSRRSRHRQHVKVPISPSSSQQQYGPSMQTTAITTSGETADSIREIRSGQFRLIQSVPDTVRERQEARGHDRSARLYVAGNHDIGFGDTIIRGTEKRFKRVHGPLNYEIPVGNHSFVILDTMSLSSIHQEIREESQTFLDSLAEDTSKSLPRILFTHVPLHRQDTVYCGTEREQQHRMIVDERGEQYQNLISQDLTREILQKLRPIMVFSGDDHDWCEMKHRVGSGGGRDDWHVPEVTVPTFSFAQGVQHPGFALLSLYRPGETAESVTQASSLSSPSSSSSSSSSFAYQHCGLPVQMAIYRAYTWLLLPTLLWILAYRIYWFMKGKPMSCGSSSGGKHAPWQQTYYSDYKEKAPVSDDTACVQPPHSQQQQQQALSQAVSTATELSPTTPRGKKAIFTLHFQNPPASTAGSCQPTAAHEAHRHHAPPPFSSPSSAFPIVSTTTTTTTAATINNTNNETHKSRVLTVLLLLRPLSCLWATRSFWRTVLADCLHLARPVLAFYGVLLLYSLAVH
ncbi:hypothetical protein DFQ27_007518 [Actinomortierella ambigua]|uniref:Calcineurin-like phosphoesterase domain-containing protein n=1 Tax=Actinomortierella ambigua TaxID=1343610 RepID=A0A9P6PW10_9FUNG|nr:hypothetical protein DFQ27_007518 [Actinomortierella ambigua]